MTHEEVTIGDARLILGDCRDVLPLLAPVSAVVTDPPYGLSFMGKRWDYDVPPTDLWALVLDRLLPGGHLLAFAGTRTQHRMAVRIEDAGFEIRDMLAWVYGSGFPKSLDVGKAIDKAAGADREVVGPNPWNHVRNHNPEAWQGSTRTGKGKYRSTGSGESDITAPATDAAKQWDGWGTALKPAFEPITLARKPLAGTVASNVTEHGTGALNIDGCRVEAADGTNTARKPSPNTSDVYAQDEHTKTMLRGGTGSDIGRWPANLIHDGSDEVVDLFPDADAGSAARFFYCAKASKADRDEGCEGLEERQYSHDGRETPIENAYQRNNSKARNHHPTVKPTDLMRYLCRLVTPPGGIVLDPFMGSGSTGKAAMLEGFRFVGIERDRRYFDIACERIARAKAQGTLDLPEPAPRMAQESLL